MSLICQIPASASQQDGLISGYLIIIIPLVSSTVLTWLAWKLGLSARVVRLQNRRQQRWEQMMDSATDAMEKNPDQYSEVNKKVINSLGRKSPNTYIGGTGRSAAISFLSAIWVTTFGLILFLTLILTSPSAQN